MSNTTTAKATVTKAQASLLAAVAKTNGPKKAPAPVAGRHARTRDALVKAGLLSKKGSGYVVTKAGHEAIADTPAKPLATTKAAASKPAKASTKAPTKAAASKPAKANGTKADLPTVGGVQHPAATWLDLLDKAGLSQTKAANEMGVAPMTVNRLLNGHGLPTAKVTVLFARTVGASPEQVWRGVCDYELACALRDHAAAK